MNTRVGALALCMAWPASPHLALLSGAQARMPAITAIALAATLALFALVAALLAAEYTSRRPRFPHYRHASFVRLLKNICNNRAPSPDFRR